MGRKLKMRAGIYRVKVSHLDNVYEYTVNATGYDDAVRSVCQRALYPLDSVTTVKFVRHYW